MGCPNWFGSSRYSKCCWKFAALAEWCFWDGKQSSCNVELKRPVWGLPLLKYQVWGYPVQAVCPSCAGIMLTYAHWARKTIKCFGKLASKQRSLPCWTWETARRTQRQKDQKNGKKSSVTHHAACPNAHGDRIMKNWLARSNVYVESCELTGTHWVSIKLALGNPWSSKAVGELPLFQEFLNGCAKNNWVMTWWDLHDLLSTSLNIPKLTDWICNSIRISLVPHAVFLHLSFILRMWPGGLSDGWSACWIGKWNLPNAPPRIQMTRTKITTVVQIVVLNESENSICKLIFLFNRLLGWPLALKQMPTSNVFTENGLLTHCKTIKEPMQNQECKWGSYTLNCTGCGREVETPSALARCGGSTENILN